MDKLTKLALEHGQVFETLAFFKESIFLADPKKKPQERLKELYKFFSEEVVKHFQFEEEEIFPSVISAGTQEEKIIVRSLQHEHIDILDKIDQFKDSILNSNLDENKRQMQESLTLSKEIMELMLKHARKEDDSLFPLLKNRGFEFA